MSDILRSTINCQKDFGVNHGKLDIVANILKYCEVTLGWSTATAQDATGGLAQLMSQELAACEVYKTSTDDQLSAKEYLQVQADIRDWFLKFMTIIEKVLEDMEAAKAAAAKGGDAKSGDAKSGDKDKKDTSDTKSEDALKELVSGLVGLIAPGQAAKSASSSSNGQAKTLGVTSPKDIPPPVPTALLDEDDQIIALRKLQQKVESSLAGK